MPTFAYHVVDVFTDRPFAGNALAVVLDADDLPTAAMQAVAREFALSETTFPGPSEVADYRVRIFTPEQELPFAGHPSVGTAWVLARLGRIRTGPVRQECAAGVLPVEVSEAGATLTGGAPSATEPLEAAALLGLVGLTAAELSGPPPRIAGSPLPFGYLPVRDGALDRLEPDLIALRRATAALGMTGLSVLSWDAAARTAHVRVFVPGVGEDPATGSAAVGLGAFLAASGLVDADGETGFEVRQGAEIGRPSRLTCTVTCAAGAAIRTTVGGGVAPVAVGEINRP